MTYLPQCFEFRNWNSMIEIEYRGGSAAYVMMSRLDSRLNDAAADTVHRPSPLPGWCLLADLSRAVLRLPRHLVPRRAEVLGWSQFRWTSPELPWSRQRRRCDIDSPSGTTASTALGQLDLWREDITDSRFTVRLPLSYLQEGGKVVRFLLWVSRVWRIFYKVV